jgi:ParB family chromosome partitioning protein
LEAPGNFEIHIITVSRYVMSHPRRRNMAEPTIPPSVVLQQIPLDRILPSRHQARKAFDEEGIKALSESIRHEGLLQAVTVRQVGDGFEMISGERRLRAVKLLGWTTIEAKIIQTVNEAEAAAKGMVENLQREDLNPIEEAEGLTSLNALDPAYWTQAKIAEVTGKSKSHVSETVRLLSLSDKLQGEFRQRNLTAEHGAELLRLPTQEVQEKAADQVLKQAFNVKQTRALVNKLLKAAKPKKTGRPRLDPMAPVWPGLVANTKVKACGYWDVTYKKDKWTFTIGAEAACTPLDFKQWFLEMGEAIPDTLPDPSAQAVQPAQAIQTVPAPSYGEEIIHPTRFPETPEEQAELEAIATNAPGPGPVLAWILGPGDPVTQRMSGKTWADVQMPSGKEGLAKVIKELKKQ